MKKQEKNNVTKKFQIVGTSKLEIALLLALIIAGTCFLIFSPDDTVNQEQTEVTSLSDAIPDAETDEPLKEAIAGADEMPAEFTPRSELDDAAKGADIERKKLKQSNPAEYLKRTTWLAQYDDYECCLELAEYYMDKDTLQACFYLRKAAEGKYKMAEVEFAIYTLLTGKEADRKDAWGVLSKLAATENLDKDFHPIALRRDYFHSLYTDKNYYNFPHFNGIGSGPEMASVYSGRMFITAEDQCIFGVTFLETYVRLNYPRATAETILAKFDNILKETKLDRSKHAASYTGVCSELTVPGTQFKVKEFDLDMLLHKDMPLKDWGIYWLKSSSAKGCKAADKVLAVFAESTK